MSRHLEEVARAADEVADDQRRIARTARSMQRMREKGWRWTRILDRESASGIFELLRRSGRRLAAATARFSGAAAQELEDEGESHRQIAARLGVTRQRVSSILGHARRAHGRE